MLLLILIRSDYMTYSRALGLNNMLLFQLISYCSSIPWTDYPFSGHLPVHCKLKAVKFSFKRSQISFRKAKSISANILQEELSSTDLCKNTLSYDLEGLFNPLGPKSVQHQFSPNNISRSTRVKVMRITKLMTKGRIL